MSVYPFVCLSIYSSVHLSVAKLCLSFRAILIHLPLALVVAGTIYHIAYIQGALQSKQDLLNLAPSIGQLVRWDLLSFIDFQ